MFSHLSKRVESLDPSGIRDAFSWGQKLANPCDLSLGLPDFDVNNSLKEAACDAIWSGKNRYTPPEGIAPLREALLARRPATEIQEKCVITPAVSGAFTLALMALLDPGESILIPDPYFVFWRGYPETLGIISCPFSTYPDFQITRERLEGALQEKTKAIVLSSPANPTGRMLTEEEAALLCSFAADHDLWIIYDEIYRTYTYDRPHIELSQLHPKTITIGGFSKSHGMTGWRIGYAIGPEEVAEAMINLQQYTYICAPTPAQWAALAALDLDLTEQCNRFQLRRDYLLAQLSEEYPLVAPEGAFYAFPQIPEGYTNSATFAQACLEEELIIIPGKAFSEQDSHFRLSFAADEATLERGVKILQKLASKSLASRT